MGLARSSSKDPLLSQTTKSQITGDGWRSERPPVQVLEKICSCWVKVHSLPSVDSVQPAFVLCWTKKGDESKAAWGGEAKSSLWIVLLTWEVSLWHHKRLQAKDTFSGNFADLTCKCFGQYLLYYFLILLFHWTKFKSVPNISMNYTHTDDGTIKTFWIAVFY